MKGKKKQLLERAYKAIDIIWQNTDYIEVMRNEVESYNNLDYLGQFTEQLAYIASVMDELHLNSELSAMGADRDFALSDKAKSESSESADMVRQYAVMKLLETDFDDDLNVAKAWKFLANNVSIINGFAQMSKKDWEDAMKISDEEMREMEEITPLLMDAFEAYKNGDMETFDVLRDKFHEIVDADKDEDAEDDENAEDDEDDDANPESL